MEQRLFDVVEQPPKKKRGINTKEHTVDAVAKYIDRVHFSDCIELLRGLPDKCLQLIVSDPPYEFTGKHSGQDGVMKGTKFLDKIKDSFGFSYDPIEFLNESLRVCNPFNAYLFCNGRTRNLYLDWARSQNFYYDEHILHKTNPIPTHMGNYMRDKEYCVFIRGKAYFNSYLAKSYYKTVHPYSVLDNSWHVCQKPVDMLSRFIEVSSRPGEVVFDGYCGSGSTAIAARNLGRHFICGDNDKCSYDKAVTRLQQIQLFNYE